MELFFTRVNEKSLLFCFHFVVIFHCFYFSSSFVTNGFEIDRLALLDFKTNLIDPQVVMKSWNDTTHICDWYGVTCGRRHQRVTMLNLQSLRLAGSISPSIGNMSFLRNIHLQNNSLNGKLPPEIGRLRRLRNLILANNSISGVIPSNISHCSNLLQLRLEGNFLLGEIPQELGFLSNLQILVLSTNNLTGKIPPSVGNLSFLSHLFIASNHVVVNIPNSFGKLKNLTQLSISNNQLSGVFPPSILNLSSLLILDLSVNQFYGNLPLDLGNRLPSLRIFSISHNLFNGSIPLTIGNASSLQQIVLVSNELTGVMPSLEKLERLFRLSITKNFLGFGRDGDMNFLTSLINATKLELLAINDNNFGGVLPATIGNLSSDIVIFAMGINMISGHIPEGIENLVGLQVFQVGYNKLSGNIPKNIGKLQNLQRLSMLQNKISGNIPFSLGNLTRLLTLDLSYNNLQGNIPKSLAQCKRIISLNLGGNNLRGEIPRQVFELSSLSIAFRVHENQLIGFLPSQIKNLINLDIVDVSENKLSGEIPNSLGSLISLERLYMQGNLFQGIIPSSLSLLKGLQILDLSHNKISGEIPKYFLNLHLQQLNLSYNDFQGEVPIGGIFNNESVVSVVGNSRLCGGISQLKLPTCDVQMSNQKRSRRLVIITLSCSIGLLLSLLVAYVLWFKKRRKGSSSSSSQSFSANSLLELSYHNLFKATNGFSSENLIGMGSYGSVYKGKHDEDGTIIAVKVFNLQRRGAIKSFVIECKALRNIRHRNLVKILTVCSSIDNQGNDFKALVYEFMENGNLENWLHPLGKTNKDDLPRCMNFSCRLNIAVDVALALDYLHHHCGAIIVHCDLKPSNILLDGEMVAHVGDFGLAKFLSQSIVNTSIIHESSSFDVRGTIGYAPPEYGIANGVSTCGDIYSFGIVLLEILTGKRPTDDVFKAGQDLHKYCKEAIPGKLVDILDPTLVEELFVGENGVKNDKRVMDGMVSLFRLGISCSVELPKDRPNISDVAGQLCVIRNQIFLKYRT